ncbi:MAG: hypothetical protein EWV55_07595 [Microcystis viridis Mv_BB_P_19951000_S69]|uniref:Uncharacterized protein n=1 Tax=Microcystis viridis Mv_BB_P_19951000_S68D TaxID=2486270 RepID=A0A552I0A1_MICVR|nr:MAG: hypothetical protein EWV55_07595 [Microcystis viridis Mv_BB_P_19951000_S69]TRU76401.1 MAG: hypothetical protein EWV47_06325 [Microcystis viridis Mv_BB_P_19951000_S68]TRU76897.1 MAG: hypothetical protein EWV77_06470 [Microcystis viridis Mv_BB_P_19951000_S68D]TRU86559.1 MAG: hypothetical protein EWV46_10025 [Microcystis viridis Mv_BB_P_19951000_S69D]
MSQYTRLDQATPQPNTNGRYQKHTHSPPHNCIKSYNLINLYIPLPHGLRCYLHYFLVSIRIFSDLGIFRMGDGCGGVRLC